MPPSLPPKTWRPIARLRHQPCHHCFSDLGLGDGPFEQPSVRALPHNLRRDTIPRLPSGASEPPTGSRENHG